MTAPFQAHSETSRQAAKIDRRSLCDRIFSMIQMTGNIGMTGAEVAHQFNIGPNSASARLRELKLAGKIKKSPERRGYSHRPGVVVESNVWKTPEHVPVEADTKRDKVREALAVIETMKKDHPGLEAWGCLKRIEEILK